MAPEQQCALQRLMIAMSMTSPRICAFGGKGKCDAQRED
jgi:hypothetical protein